MPSGLSMPAETMKDVLFRCEDHWYWEKADIHFVELCNNQCYDK